ncbi:MAG: hypothetical protein F6K48_20665 [Okeania sp. SIO3H1]|nr:hypothetical protein [Okeania sp. SIO3H1]
MKKVLLATAALVALTSTAHSEEVTWITGLPGGGYAANAKDGAARLEQRGHTVTIENRNGSDDITLAACQAAEDGSLVVWEAQLDALYKREINDGCVLVEAATSKMEYAMLFFPPDSRNRKLSHLDESDVVLVGKVGSGAELTNRNMAEIEKEHGRGDDWSNAERATGDFRRATSMATRGTISAVMLVGTISNKDAIRLIKAGWRFGELWDKDINDLKWGSRPLYNSTKITFVVDGKKHTNHVYEVPSLIGTTEAVEFDHTDLFDDIISAAVR